MKNIVRIRGNKVNLCLRRTDEEALQKYAEWFSDEHFNIFMDKHTVLSTPEWLKEHFADKHSPEIYAFNIVTVDDRLIGDCYLMPTLCTRNCELSICIGEEGGRGLGYGTEALKLLVCYAFEQLHMHTVCLQVYLENEPAVRCYEKLGFQRCVNIHEAVWFNGAYRDNWIMQITENEFKELRAEYGV